MDAAELAELAAHIKILAFKEVQDKSPEYYLRHIFRWYSARYATPLHLVGEIPTSDVLTAYWEEQFENMDAEELAQEKALLIETESQRLARVTAEEADQALDIDFAAFAEAEAKKLEDKPMQTQAAVRPIAHPHKQAPEAELPEPVAVPPDVEVRFVDPGFFDDM